MSRVVGVLRELGWPRRFLLVFIAWAVGSSVNHGDVAGALVALAVGVIFLVPRGSGSGFRRSLMGRGSSVFASRVPRFAGMASAKAEDRSEVYPEVPRPRPAGSQAVAE